MAKSTTSIIVATAISLLLSPTAYAFVGVAPGSARVSNLPLFGAKLEGREIEGTLTPTNNFVLVKKAPVLDQTDGGILLTGSVSLIL
jgi:hypothetical protein